LTQPWTILFVDDDVDFLEAQAAFFRSRGHTILTAEDSEEAREILAGTTPDIIFLDLVMERFDTGFRLAYEIRKSARLDQSPIVMLSGVAARTGQRFGADEEALKKWSRVDRYLDKPVTGKQLLAVAEELLADRPPREE
jgi:CheY-like chemotaxis protein